MGHGQGYLFADLGGAQVDLQFLDLGLQLGKFAIFHLLAGLSARWPRLQAAHGTLQELPPQHIKTASADTE
jgi:hypothetical protein